MWRIVWKVMLSVAWDTFWTALGGCLAGVFAAAMVFQAFDSTRTCYRAEVIKGEAVCTVWVRKAP